LEGDDYAGLARQVHDGVIALGPQPVDADHSAPDTA
jgi:hypothetical protein